MHSTSALSKSALEIVVGELINPEISDGEMRDLIDYYKWITDALDPEEIDTAFLDTSETN